MRILLDTNILLDIFTGRKPFVKEAEKFLAMAALGDAEIWASAKSTTDIFYVMGKKFEASAIYTALEKSLDYVNYCSVDAQDISEAVKRQWADFEDCIVALCAEKIGASFLITRDTAGFTVSPIPSINPEDFFAMLKKEYGITYAEVDW